MGTERKSATVLPLHRNAILARNARRRLAKQQRLAADPKEAAKERQRQERAERNAEARNRQLSLDLPDGMAWTFATRRDRED